VSIPLTRFEVEVDAQSTRDALDDLEEKWSTERVYVVGTDVEYAVYLEFGTRHMPPYPFVRPALRELEANPNSIISRNSGFNTVDELPNADTLVKVVATALASQVEKNASAIAASDRSPGVDPEHPQRQTGTLVNSIGAQRVN